MPAIFMSETASVRSTTFVPSSCETRCRRLQFEALGYLNLPE